MIPFITNSFNISYIFLRFIDYFHWFSVHFHESYCFFLYLIYTNFRIAIVQYSFYSLLFSYPQCTRGQTVFCTLRVNKFKAKDYSI